MFRRNRIAMQNNALSASQIEVLAKANQLVSNNNSTDAAPLYAELARELDGNRPRAAANLHAACGSRLCRLGQRTARTGASARRVDHVHSISDDQSHASILCQHHAQIQ